MMPYQTHPVGKSPLSLKVSKFFQVEFPKLCQLEKSFLLDCCIENCWFFLYRLLMSKSFIFAILFGVNVPLNRSIFFFLTNTWIYRMLNFDGLLCKVARTQSHSQSHMHIVRHFRESSHLILILLIHYEDLVRREGRIQGTPIPRQRI